MPERWPPCAKSSYISDGFAITVCANISLSAFSSGVVLGRHGGMIQQIFMPFYLGLGGPIGSGRQFFPWIHIDDIVSLFIFAIENSEVESISLWQEPEQIMMQFVIRLLLGNAFVFL